MQRTTIMASDDVLTQLKRLARDRGVSLGAIIREALAEKAQTAFPRPRSIGSGDSGLADTSRLASEGRVPPRSWR